MFSYIQQKPEYFTPENDVFSQKILVNFVLNYFLFKSISILPTKMY